jgi:nucleotide-binding universal stress UspA family protein
MPTVSFPTIVLAAVDYSELSSMILERALALIRHVPSAALHCLHVNHGSRSREDQEARSERFSEWLTAQLGGLGARVDSLRVVPHELRGHPIQVIVETAADLGADLIVVGSHDPQGIDRILMGSVAEAVVRKAGCPVLVVRPKAHNDPLPNAEPASPRCMI